jgi:FkbM family methyltransferase
MPQTKDFNNIYRKIHKKFHRALVKLRKDGFRHQQTLMKGFNSLCIVDVGANIGDTAAKYLRLFPEAQLYCFEPFPSTVETLRSRFSNYSRIQIYPIALSDYSGTTELYVSTFSDMNSLLPPERAWGFDSTPNKVHVPSQTLDSFCEESSIQEIHVLKLDVQGGEIHVLNGALNLLRTNAIWLIYAEVSIYPLYRAQPQLRDILSYLGEFNYELFNIYNANESKTGQLLWGDALFTSRNLRDKLKATDNVYGSW